MGEALQPSQGPRPESVEGPAADMKRRTLTKHRARARAAAPPTGPARRSAKANLHHCVYVVLLASDVGRLRKVRAANPDRSVEKPCVYVGMTGLTPEERFANHQAGVKDAWVVRRYGVRLLPELYAHLNPMPFEAAAQMEKDLAEDLRRAGYTVTGGH